MNLGIAYWERPVDDQAENRERAIEAFEDVLSVWTREADPNAWAAVRMKLGAAYLDQLTGDRAENLERTIGAFRRRRVGLDPRGQSRRMGRHSHEVRHSLP
jgi:hypothetical protein